MLWQEFLIHPTDFAVADTHSVVSSSSQVQHLDSSKSKMNQEGCLVDITVLSISQKKAENRVIKKVSIFSFLQITME